MNQNIIKNGFVLAGLSNILGVLICSKMFTNQVMMDTQPAVMSYFGLLAIILWGLAYIAVCKSYRHVPWLIGVFVVEKLAYVITWFMFLSNQSLTNVYDQDVLAGIFYSIYGLNDFAFMLFFAYVFWTIRQRSSA